MDMTRGGVNGIVTGPTMPSAATVKYLEMLVLKAGKAIPQVEREKSARAHVGEIEAQAKVSEELAGKLQEIQLSNPDKFNVARTVIESLHSEIKYDRAKHSNSELKPAHKRIAKKVSAAVQKTSP